MVQQPCKECVEARRLQDEEAVQLLAVQLADGDGAEDLGRGEGDVQEEAHARRAQLAQDVRGQQHQVVVVDPHLYMQCTCMGQMDAHVHPVVSRGSTPGRRCRTPR